MPLVGFVSWYFGFCSQRKTHFLGFETKIMDEGPFLDGKGSFFLCCCCFSFVLLETYDLIFESQKSEKNKGDHRAKYDEGEGGDEEGECYGGYSFLFCWYLPLFFSFSLFNQSLFVILHLLLLSCKWKEWKGYEGGGGDKGEGGEEEGEFSSPFPFLISCKQN